MWKHQWAIVEGILMNLDWGGGGAGHNHRINKIYWHHFFVKTSCCNSTQLLERPHSAQRTDKFRFWKNPNELKFWGQRDSPPQRNALACVTNIKGQLICCLNVHRVYLQIYWPGCQVKKMNQARSVKIFDYWYVSWIQKCHWSNFAWEWYQT